MEEASDGLCVDVNCANTGEHTPRAERNNRTIKDSFRRTCLRVNYKRTPRAMIETLGEITAERLNMFPAKNGMSSHCSPATIATRKVLDCNKHCECSFGEHLQACNELKKTSEM